MVKSTLYKIVKYFLVVFIIMDISILINYFLKDYGEPIKIENINKAVLIFLPLTLVCFILERILRNR